MGYAEGEQEDRRGEMESMRASMTQGMNPVKAQDAPQIERQHLWQIRAIDELEQAWQDLRMRLGPIIGPSRDFDTEKDPGEDREEMSDVAANISSQTDRIHALRKNILSIIPRVEC